MKTKSNKPKELVTLQDEWLETCPACGCPDMTRTGPLVTIMEENVKGQDVEFDEPGDTLERIGAWTYTCMGCDHTWRVETGRAVTPPELAGALETLANMRAPSVEKLLRQYEYAVEADAVAAVVRAYLATREAPAASVFEMALTVTCGAHEVDITRFVVAADLAAALAVARPVAAQFFSDAEPNGEDAWITASGDLAWTLDVHEVTDLPAYARNPAAKVALTAMPVKEARHV